ncbi:hypothetical protein SAMN04489727_1532 [Amycolatopsis tolypomycina]|uniref:Uncharacterized protein n=1 Tax=Amycolatopsis tolypomycina TaxID=208445 RepID=A0A1H4J723_9PSEU|nr:hypothetical protein [Amycolatopsis tolypomycina]SEB41372.1 hypothetical protein SAMN04489727_1532 [Amycolatopsis tolypomycina]
MKITLGRLAGAVLAGALLTLTVAPAALAQEAPATSTEAAPTSEAPPTTNLPTTTPATSTSQQPTSQQPTSTQPTTQPTGTGTPTSGKPTHTSSTPTTEPTDPFPHGDDYIDDYAYAWEFDDGTGILVIACAAGEPTNIVANDFTVAGGPFQDGADGRYWGFDIQLNEGKHLTDDTKVSWTCEGKPVTRPVGHGGGSATAGGQVKVTPKAGGVETGGGATARS